MNYSNSIWEKNIKTELSPGENAIPYRIQEPGTFVLYINITDIPGAEGAMTHSFRMDPDPGEDQVDITGTYMFVDVEENGELWLGWAGGE
jgi:hypothetical protein